MVKKSTPKIKLEAEVKSKKPAKEEKPAVPARYFESLGSRKNAVARVRLYTKQPGVLHINDKDFREYFRESRLQKEILKPLETMNVMEKLGASVKVRGGGLTGQAEAVRHGLARALVLFNPDFRKRLRRAGFLTRDDRMVERKKYGLKKARRAPQWAKR
ncbi:MAG: 30S ribosomal protein S9 [Candidatus Harrisonbacteria bacterium]|nr:30S ribosomal protein S9 [Candidatus Harrisonbacteria bacterium]